MHPAFADLKSRLQEIHDLNGAAQLMGWDQRTMMPERGAAVRAERMATVGRVAHEKFTSDEIGRLLDQLRGEEEQLPYDSDEASLIRRTRRDYEKARKVPGELRAERSRAAAEGYRVWIDARKNADFARFVPALERNLELTKRYIACYDGDGRTPYDVLLDDYEPGLTTEEIRGVFDRVKEGLKPLTERVAARSDRVDNRCLHGHFPVDKQREFALHVLARFGFTEDAWRLDPTVHPFASSMATSDIRITTRYHEGFLNPALFGSMHEFGHGVYEHGVSPALERTPLCRGASMALHESQSRMWENLVGRGRPFWRFFFPTLRQTFPDQFKEVDAEGVYRAVNKLQPSFIRVEADEATYNLHIILRFELEQEIISERIKLTDLPEAWNARMRDHLGVEVPNDAQGVLQDVHWSGGSLGYFPTYALGNVVSHQIWQRLRADLSDLESQFAAGEFAPLREWLREHLYRHGRKFTPKETLERVAGTDRLDPDPLLAYLTAKVDDLYGAA